MATKKVLVGVDDEVWRKVKARAAEEGRSVGVVVENALKLYLGAPTTLFPKTLAACEASSRAFYEAAFPVVEKKPETWVEESAAKVKSSVDRQREIAERQAWLRDHPEDEQQ